jgi:hypothetical protein
VTRTRKRLFLPEDRTPDIGKALVELGVDPSHPKSVGSVGRQLMTIWRKDHRDDM